MKKKSTINLSVTMRALSGRPANLSVMPTAPLDRNYCGDNANGSVEPL